jgi:large subunit ribosomal protein L1
MNVSDVEKALAELRKDMEQRKFKQTLDLIVNLKKFNLKKDAVNIFVALPHKTKNKKICGFFEVKSDKIPTITKSEFAKYADKKLVKKLGNEYEFFIAQASVMPAVATTFGRVLGPLGKMPSPQLGILMDINEKSINEVVDRINSSVKVRTKEPSIKIPVGGESMDDLKIAENVQAVYNAVEKALPRGKDNIKNIKIKFTMSKPVRVEF